jgi:hypothetical protein
LRRVEAMRRRVMPVARIPMVGGRRQANPEASGGILGQFAGEFKFDDLE